MSDRHGKRRGTLLMRPGTIAHMKLPDGSRKPLSTMHVRITEFTVGEQGRQQMPGDLPPQTGYTYAAEFSIDEARAAGATGVEFNKPVVAYLENFLGYLVGQAVPNGFYDPQVGQWKADRSGRIVKVLAVTDGKAALDLDGDELADDAAALASLGIDDLERARLGELFQPGQGLWRVELEHFTSVDFNWAGRCPEWEDNPGVPMCQAPSVEQDFGRKPPGQSCAAGSIIRCQDQTVGEAIPIAGTPFQLMHWSDRSPRSSHKLEVALTSQVRLAPNLKAIWVDVSIAGQRVQQSFGFPFTADMRFPFEWDGKDAFGRVLQGPQRVVVKVGYVYGLSPQSSGTFGDFSDAATVVPPGYDSEPRSTLMVERTWRGWMGTLQAAELGLGGWDFDVHHVYDAQLRTLHSGTGGVVSAEELPLAVHEFAGTGEPGNDGDGKPASLAKINRPSGLAVWPDGAVAISD